MFNTCTDQRIYSLEVLVLSKVSHQVSGDNEYPWVCFMFHVISSVIVTITVKDYLQSCINGININRDIARQHTSHYLQTFDIDKFVAVVHF